MRSVYEALHIFELIRQEEQDADCIFNNIAADAEGHLGATYLYRLRAMLGHRQCTMRGTSSTLSDGMIGTLRPLLASSEDEQYQRRRIRR